MNQQRTTEIWRSLLLSGARMTTTEEIATLANAIGKGATESVRYLQREGYIKRVFRGIFYVVAPNERAIGKQDYSVYEMIAAGLDLRGAAPWYFGLETGLKLNEMTHEFFNIDQVISASLKSTRIINVLGLPLRIIRWSTDLFIPGSIITRRTEHDVVIRYSNREKTVLDLAYRRFLDGASTHYVRSIFSEYGDMIIDDLAKNYLASYPRAFRETIEEGHGH